MDEDGERLQALEDLDLRAVDPALPDGARVLAVTRDGERFVDA